MNNNLVLDSGGWIELESTKINENYNSTMALFNSEKPQLTIIPKNFTLGLTKAEDFGARTRELFSIYTGILNEMQSSREWIALKIHSNYHTNSQFQNGINIVEEENDFDVMGYHLDAIAFKFTWQDNTLEHPWKPWNWKLGLFSDDCDDSHCFFHPLDNKATRSYYDGNDIRLEIFGMTPTLKQPLNFFQIK